MLRTEKEHFVVLVIASHSLDDGHPSLCMIRGCDDFVADLYLAIISPPCGMEHPLICQWGCWCFQEVHQYDACAIHLCIADKRHPHVF